MNKLFLHEWLAVVVIAALLVGLFAATSMSRQRCLQGVSSVEQSKNTPLSLSHEIEVQIEGAVQSPGRYRIEKGTTLQEVIQLAGPECDADLRRFKMERKLTRPQSIRIRRRAMIRVYVEGAVQQEGEVVEIVEIVVPKGTRVCELNDKVELAPQADRKALQRRRYLKDGETITVEEIEI